MTVRTEVIVDGPRKYVVALFNDGDDETTVLKVDASAVTAPDGSLGGLTFTLRRVNWTAYGYTGVNVLYNSTANDLMVALSPDTGHLDLQDVGGGIHDPRNTGFNGDILVTTVGTPAGAAGYTIVLEFVKDAV